MLKKIEIEGETLIEDEDGNVCTVKDYLHDYVSNLFFIKDFPDSPGFIELNVKFKKVLDECGADTAPEHWTEDPYHPLIFGKRFTNIVTGEKL